MKLFIENKTLLTCGLTLINLIVIVLFSLLGTVNRTPSEDISLNNMIGLMDKISMDLARSDADVNNFIITSNNEYIDRYRKLRRPMADNIASLEFMLTQDSEQRKKYIEFKDLVNKHIFLLENSIQQKKNNQISSIPDFLESQEKNKSVIQVAKYQEKLIAEQKALFINKQKEVEFSAKSREYIVVSASIASLLISIIAIGAIVTDLNERREREKYLQDINDNKDRFFTLISHDLKGPAHNLIGISDILLNDPSITQDEIITFLSHLNLTAKKNYNLLENLLEWSRVQMGSLTISSANCNVNEIVQEITLHLQEKLVQKNLTLTNNVEDTVVVFADYNAVKTVVRNLLNNAIKFTTSGGKISIEAFQGKSFVTISITDSGIGIDAMTKNNLFQPGRIVSKYGTEGESGSGIGLLLCKELIVRNKGKIWVESEVGAGACFRFTLPIAQFDKNNNDVVSKVS